MAKAKLKNSVGTRRSSTKNTRRLPCLLNRPGYVRAHKMVQRSDKRRKDDLKERQTAVFCKQQKHEKAAKPAVTSPTLDPCGKINLPWIQLRQCSVSDGSRMPYSGLTERIYRNAPTCNPWCGSQCDERPRFGAGRGKLAAWGAYNGIEDVVVKKNTILQTHPSNTIFSWTLPNDSPSYIYFGRSTL